MSQHQGENDFADRLRAMHRHRVSGGECAEYAQSPADPSSAHCAQSAENSRAPDTAHPPATTGYATTDDESADGQPAYRACDKPLPMGLTARDAGVNCLILAYALRLHTEHWLGVSGDDPLGRDVCECVRQDIGEAVQALDGAMTGRQPGASTRKTDVESQTGDRQTPKGMG